MIIEVIKIIPKDFINIHVELWKTYERDSGVFMISAYSFKGDYIGDPDLVADLYSRYGICEDYSMNAQANVVSCGFSPKDNKYYGWSLVNIHTSIKGYGIGDTITREDKGYTPDTVEEVKLTCPFLRTGDVCEYPRYEDYEENDIDHTCSNENCTQFLGRGEWTASSLEDAKEMAIQYSKYI
jgi:hypothetical protein